MVQMLQVRHKVNAPVWHHVKCLDTPMECSVDSGRIWVHRCGDSSMWGVHHVCLCPQTRGQVSSGPAVPCPCCLGLPPGLRLWLQEHPCKMGNSVGRFEGTEAQMARADGVHTASSMASEFLSVI